jgi:hypothetical protein
MEPGLPPETFVEADLPILFDSDLPNSFFASLGVDGDVDLPSSVGTALCVDFFKGSGKGDVFVGSFCFVDLRKSQRVTRPA